MGFNRDTFYEVRRAFQNGGVAALVENRRGPRGPHPNRVSAEIKTKILDYCLNRPTHGAQRVPNELRLQGVTVSSSDVRGVWLHHNLETQIKRLLRLEAVSRENTLVLSEQKIKILEHFTPEFRCWHVEASRPGELLNQDTFYWGILKGVGKVYVLVVVDVFCSIPFAKLYISKMPITSCDLLYDRGLPFYETLGVPVGAVLTDNGCKFCGRPKIHLYKLLTVMEEIEHRTTKIRFPRTNGFVERMNRNMLDKCLRVSGRTTWFESIKQIQADLDKFLMYYNLERSHQGYDMQGRTPAQALWENAPCQRIAVLHGVPCNRRRCSRRSSMMITPVDRVSENFRACTYRACTSSR